MGPRLVRKPLFVCWTDWCVRVVLWQPGANWSAQQDGCSSSGLGYVFGPLRSVGSITMVNCSASELPSAGLLIQAKAKATVDAKGKLGRVGALVTATWLNVSSLHLQNTAMRPTKADGVTESPVMIVGEAAPNNFTVGNILLERITVTDQLDRSWLTAGRLGPYAAAAGTFENVTGSCNVFTTFAEGCGINAPTVVQAGFTGHVVCHASRHDEAPQKNPHDVGIARYTLRLPPRGHTPREAQSAHVASSLLRQVTGVLDDDAFPTEEASTLQSIVYPVLRDFDRRAGAWATMEDPQTGRAFNVTVGQSNTFADWTLVTILPDAATAVCERRFARFGAFGYYRLGQPPLLMRKPVGNLESVQTQAMQTFPDAWYSSFAFAHTDVLADDVRESAPQDDPTFEAVLPMLSPTKPYLTIGTIDQAQKFTVCPTGVIKRSNGTLRDPPAAGGQGSVVFDPADYLRVERPDLANGSFFTDSTAGVVGDFLPVANYGFSNTVTGQAWEILAIAVSGGIGVSGTTASATSVQPLLVRICELGGRVQYVAAGGDGGPRLLNATVAAPAFFSELQAVNTSFASILAADDTATAAFPRSERRLVAQPLAGMAQALATFDGLHQRYGTGIDYYSNTKELMTVATTVNTALLLWGAGGHGSAATARLVQCVQSFAPSIAQSGMTDGDVLLVAATPRRRGQQPDSQGQGNNW